MLAVELHLSCINSSLPSAAYMRQWIRTALAQVMACHLYDVKPLPEPMLVYHRLDPLEQMSVKIELEFYHFHSRKCIWNCRLPKWGPFCPGGDKLTHLYPSVLSISIGLLTGPWEMWLQILKKMCIFSDSFLLFLVWTWPEHLCSQDPMYKKSALVHVMALCHQASIHYLDHSWQISVRPFGINRDQWVKERQGWLWPMYW